MNSSFTQHTILTGGNHPSVELDGTGNVVERRFVQGFQRGSQNYYLTKDHLGSVREVVDASGTTRAKYDYDPYGKRTRIAGDMDYVHGFTGHYHHESGLILTWYRGYDAELGRWISRDPIQERGGINLYGYVSNTSLNIIDELALKGNSPLDKCIEEYLKTHYRSIVGDLLVPYLSLGNLLDVDFILTSLTSGALKAFIIGGTAGISSYLVREGYNIIMNSSPASYGSIFGLEQRANVSASLIANRQRISSTMAAAMRILGIAGAVLTTAATIAHAEAYLHCRKCK